MTNIINVSRFLIFVRNDIIPDVTKLRRWVSTIIFIRFDYPHLNVKQFDSVFTKLIKLL
jgi:hypothetical protein